MTSNDEPTRWNSNQNQNPHHPAEPKPPTEEDLLTQYSPELRLRAASLSNDLHLREDLYQEGAIGLINAARRFDRSRGVKFGTWARRHMRGRMLNYLRAERNQLGCAFLHDTCYLAEDHDEHNPPQEDCRPITAAEAMEQSAQFLFHVDLLLLQQQMRATERELTARQRQIFSMRYSEGLLPSDIAQRLGISPARVTQALREAVAKVQRAFARA